MNNIVEVLGDIRGLKGNEKNKIKCKKERNIKHFNGQK